MMVSCAMHLLLLVGAIWMTARRVEPPPRLIVDLTVNEIRAEAPPDRRPAPPEAVVKPAAAKRPAVRSAPVKTVLPKTRVVEKAPEEKIEVPAAAPEKSPVPIMTVNAPVQPPVPVVVADREQNSHVRQESRGGETASANQGKVTIEREEKRYLKEHFIYIRDRVNKMISYPPMAQRMGWRGRAVVTFEVTEKGFARDVRVKQSSGHAVLDEAAVEAVKRSAPFPPPPAVAEITMPIVFKLKGD